MSAGTQPLLAPAEPVLVSVAAFGLAGSVVEMPTGPFPPDEWFTLVRACEARGLLGMLAAAAHSGVVSLSEEHTEELSLRENEAAAAALLAEQGVVRLSALLTAAAIDHRLLGAPARARLGYRQAGIRLFDAAAVLVAPHDHDIAIPRGVTVQPYLTPTVGPIIDVTLLSQPATLLDLAAHRVPTPSIEEHLVLACIELAGHPGGAGALVIRRDLAELALSKQTDGARVQRIAESWGVANVVTRALVQTWDLFRLADRTRLSVWAHRVTDTPATPRTASGPAPHPSPPPRRRRRVRRLVRRARKLTPSRAAANLAARWPSARRSKRR